MWCVVIIGMGLWVLGVMSLDWKSDRFIGVSDEVNRLARIEAQLAKIASFLEIYADSGVYTEKKE